MSKPSRHDAIIFTRLSTVAPEEIINHMNTPRVAEHMPLLVTKWTHDTISQFIEAKEECWHRDGLGHWAILYEGAYVGWGGFQKEDDEWDFGLVLKPDCFGLGIQIAQKAIQIAVSDARIPFVTFLVPPSRKNLGALARLGAIYVGEIEYENARFLKYRLNTS